MRPRTPQWLVKTRKHGEPWRTDSPWSGEDSAVAHAQRLASQRLDLGGRVVPAFFEVAVFYSGDEVWSSRRVGA